MLNLPVLIFTVAWLVENYENMSSIHIRIGVGYLACRHQITANSTPADPRLYI